MKDIQITLFLAVALCISIVPTAAQTSISGVVIDSLSTPIIGATVVIEGTTNYSVADMNGQFRIVNLTDQTYTLCVSMMGYQSVRMEHIKPSEEQMQIILSADVETINEVVIKAQRRMNSETSMIQGIKSFNMVVSGVSGRSISKTQDRDAGEVVKRIPGISIMENKFIIARGLSQRYNNAWINGASVPSSEADSRAFSFDVIPAGQIENIMIVKSPVPELPADFTGGFVKINTKDTPEQQPISISYSMGVNTIAHFNSFRYNSIGGSELLGIDAGHRMLKGGIAMEYDNNDAKLVTDMTRNGFNNNWSIKTHKPVPDQKGSVSFGKSIELPHASQLTLNGAVNYSHSSLSYLNMENARFGVYNKAEDKSEYLYKYIDNQYLTTVKAGALLNFAYLRGNNRYNFRNIFNQIGQNKLTEREGWQNISSLYNQQKTEYNYSSRTTYSGQFSGTHDLSRNRFDWSIGYSYANKNQPDRRIVNRQQNDLYGDTHYGQMRIDQNDIERNFVKLIEHIGSLNVDYSHRFSQNVELRSGLFADYRTRKYRNRAFMYRFNPNNVPEDFAYGDVISEILADNNYSADRLYLYDDTDNRDSYEGRTISSAAYAALNLALEHWNLYVGTRLEQSNMTLTSYMRTNEWTSRKRNYNYLDLFPSANITYSLNEKHLLRAAYGLSTNRPEFREVSSSVYYDFDLFSDVKGNSDLKAAYIQNVDLRYEWYPSVSETVSLAIFYKHFRHPIETTFLDAGGSYTYTFENANRANAYGMELELRKNLRFIGMPQFDLTFNGALIHSEVKFDKDSNEHNRPMQGQSPYLINTGIYYNSPNSGFTVCLLYNRIGKRIVGIGKTDMSIGGTIDNDIPDMYEMPHDAIDLVFGKNFGKVWTLKLNVKDVLAQDVIFCQFPKYTNDSDQLIERQQITKRFNPGRSITLSISAKF